MTSAVAVTFCPACGGGGFCLPHCRVTSARVQYHQRTAWHAQVLLATAANQEQRTYWRQRLEAACLALQEER